MAEEIARMISIFEERINKGINIIILDQDDYELLHLIRTGLKKRNISNTEVWSYIDLDSDHDKVRRISQQEMDKAMEMYRLYDFSDRVTVISDTAQYGRLYNYVKNGILTKEEMVDAILHGK